MAAQPDIFFRCGHCNTSLVVNRSAAGMTFNCQECGTPVTVPKAATPPPNLETKSAEIKRRLIENESQRTEVTGYINQLSIQLHRWQLRSQMLDERKSQLETDLRTLGT